MKLVCVIILSVISVIFSSCTFYYKTADINTKLKSSVEQINSNCSLVQQKIEVAKNHFISLNCNVITPTVEKAKGYLSNLENSMQELNKIKISVNNEYLKFSQYSKGKTQIKSNSEEWDKFKETKKIMKQCVKDFDKKGKVINSIAKDYTTFISKEFNSVEYVEVTDLKKKFRIMIDEFNHKEKELYVNLNNQETQVLEIISKNTSSNEDKCKNLSEDLLKISNEKNKVAEIKNEIEQKIIGFEKATSEIKTIYSCSVEWEIVREIELNIANLGSDAYKVFQDLQAIHNHMQEIITSMN
jgi:hypothetical protein